jgi:hypothetical protein
MQPSGYLIVVEVELEKTQRRGVALRRDLLLKLAYKRRVQKLLETRHEFLRRLKDVQQKMNRRSMVNSEPDLLNSSAAVCISMLS